MTTAKPSLELLRSLTDEHVLRELMRHRRLTRADLAAAVACPSPRSGSVRRLTETGLASPRGTHPGGRGMGRVGSYYALADIAGTALAISIASDGVVVERVDVHGDVIGRTRHDISRPAHADRVAAACAPPRRRRAGRRRTRPAGGRQRRRPCTGATAAGALPDAPFLLGDLDPVAVLKPHVAGPVVVDNDAWAAQAERDLDPAGLSDFAYVFLGEGLGCAVVSDGAVRRGHTGVAGEIAHLVTTGPEGSNPVHRRVRRPGLRHAGTTAIDVERVRRLSPAGRTALGYAVSGVLAAVVALADPGWC